MALNPIVSTAALLRARGVAAPARPCTPGGAMSAAPAPPAPLTRRRRGVTGCCTGRRRGGDEDTMASCIHGGEGSAAQSYSGAPVVY
jgi:hypothetical protein